MATGSQIMDAENKLNELREVIGTDKILFPLLSYLLLNAEKLNLFSLNQQLDQMISEQKIEAKDLAVTLQTWYSTLNSEQKSTLLFMLASPIQPQ